jgi:hypothetical protein
MTTVTQLATGLGGAIGCDLQPSQHRLLFVEFDGKLSALNLVPTTAIVSSGTTTLKGTLTFDLDTGLEGGASALPSTSGGNSRPPHYARWPR